MRKRAGQAIIMALVLLAGCDGDPTGQAAPPPAEHRLPTLVALQEPLPVRYTTTGTVVSD